MVAIDSTIYVKGFKFKDGAYRTYDEFRFNSPSLKYKYRSEVKKDALNLYIEKDTNVVIYGLNQHLENKLRKKKVWGYCKDGQVYVLSGYGIGVNEFLKLDIIGGMMLTSKDIKIDKGGIQPNAGIAISKRGVSADVGAVIITGYTTKKVKLRLVDAETGEIEMYNLTNFISIIKRDKILYTDFLKIKGEKSKKNMMFIYLNKFNKRNPFYIMSSTYK